MSMLTQPRLGDSGKGTAPTLASAQRAAMHLSRVRFILVSIAFFW